MSLELNLDEVLESDKSLLPPDVVISKIGSQIEDLTKGFIKAEVKKYDGPIESYDQLSSLGMIAASLGSSMLHKDIQDDLGEIGYQDFKFEFYLRSSKIESYKYRILFFEYGIGMYPVKIVLEQGIADEIFKKEDSNYVIEYETKEELENVITNVLQTKKVIKVMKDLIHATKRIVELEGLEIEQIDYNSED